MTPGRGRDEALRFEAARRWRAWHEWPGIMGLASGIALWIFFVVGVLAPVGDALARFRSGSPSAPAQVCAMMDVGTSAAAGQACLCACPESPPPELPPRSG